jgi:hypothetical protein
LERFVKPLPTLLLILLPAVALRAEDAQITIDPTKIIAPVSPYLTGVCMEDVNHEIYGGLYSQLIFGESFQEPEATAGSGLSKWWKPVQSGTAQGKYELIHDTPFVGAQSQRVTFTSGAGQFGISNAGLNGQGIYRGGGFNARLWVRASKPVELVVGFASIDGKERWDQVVKVGEGNWHEVMPIDLGGFTAGPFGNHLCITLRLKSPGTIDLGYVFFDGNLNQFKRLPVRRDVAELLIKQGVTVMRYGGSMINDPAYRWKNMIGPRAKRPPTHGTWYPFSSNGWGIPDFCAFCDAAGFLGIPAFNMGETPQDMADFLEYAHGGPGTKWGAQRIADIQNQGLVQLAAPFKVHVIELGNEEQVNDAYWQKFEPIARAIWSRDPKMILTVGDFHYDNVITDPFHFAGGAVDTLAAHQKILALAKEYGAEVWFDVHLNTQEIPAANAIDPLLSFIRALKSISNGAKFHVVTYELNADRHDLTRALANARMIGLIERAGAEPVVTSANALQVDGQNDNGWDQGLIFMNPRQVWVQPPGYVMQMISRNRLANVVQADCNDPNLDVTATASADGRTIVLQVVNPGDTRVTARVTAPALESAKTIHVWELAGTLDAVNTAAAPDQIVPHETTEPIFSREAIPPPHLFPPHSFTVMRLE